MQSFTPTSSSAPQTPRSHQRPSDVFAWDLHAYAAAALHERRRRAAAIAGLRAATSCNNLRSLCTTWGLAPGPLDRRMLQHAISAGCLQALACPVCMDVSPDASHAWSMWYACTHMHSAVMGSPSRAQDAFLGPQLSVRTPRPQMRMTEP